MTWLYLGLIVAQSLDVSSTALKLHQGCREIAWPTQNIWVMGAGKSAGVYGVIMLGKKHRRIAAGIALAGIASGVLAGTHNLQQGCH